MPLLTAPTLSIAGKKKLEPFRHPDIVKTDAVQLIVHGDNTLTYYKRGTVFSQITASKLYAPYDNATSGGKNVASCILEYDTVVYKGPTSGDQAYWFGNWTTSFPGPHGERLTAVPMYFGGDFLTSDLYIGAGTAEDTAARLDATNSNDLVDTLAALADLNATLVMITDIAATPDVYEFRF
jgi:hypothetical protein